MGLMGMLRCFAGTLAAACLSTASLGQFVTSNPPMPPPPVGTWQRTAHNPAASVGLPLLLTDGTVFVQNPETSTWYKLTPDITGSYVNGTWTTAASMPTGYAPLYFGSGVLANGQVVCIGGEYNVSGGGVWTNLAAVYNPVTNAWTPLAAPSGWSNIGDCQTVVMPNGRFVIAQPTDSRMASLDPTLLTWTALNGANKQDRFDEEGWTLLPDGSILTCDAINSPHAERYIPSQDQWISAGATPQGLEDPGSQELGPMILRPNGTVLALGATGHNAIYSPGANLTDTGTWAAAPDFPGGNDIADGPACLLPNGNVLCDTSPGVFNSPITMYEFDGTNFNAAPAIPRSGNDSSYIGNYLVLPNGQVMFTDFSRDVEIYTPSGGPQDAWRPTITSFPFLVMTGNTYTIGGTQFNGLSQCNAYGDDATNASNYPIVRITNIATGHVKYCRTHNHSTMAVATGSAPVSTLVDIPANTEQGASNLEVIANGIPSLPMRINVVTLGSVGSSPVNPIHVGGH